MRTPRLRSFASVAAIAATSLVLSACSGADSGSDDDPLQAALVLSACSGADSGSDDDPLQVGVFLPGSTTDTGFMQSAHDGVERIEEDRSDDVDITFVEEVAQPDYQQVLTRLAGENDLVVAVGGQTDADIRTVAPSHPDVVFVEIGGPADAEPMDNLAYYDPEQAEAEYMSGAVAALSSETGRIGFIGGVELPAIVNAARAFENGAQAVDPEIEVVSPQYIGDFNDPATSRQAAAANYAADVDVIGQIVNLGKRGIEQAAREADAGYISGPIPGPCEPDSPIIGYVETDIGAEIEYAVDAVLNDTWEAAQVPFGLTTDRSATDFVLCSEDAQIAAELDAVIESLASGDVTPY